MDTIIIFIEITDLFNMYGGIGVSFVVINTEWNDYSDIKLEEKYYTKETFGVEIKGGITKPIAENLNLLVEMKYRIHGNVGIIELTPGELINFSGLGILVGAEIVIF